MCSRRGFARIPQVEQDADSLDDALAAYPRLTQLELRQTPWLPEHLPCLQPLSGVQRPPRFSCLRSLAFRSLLADMRARVLPWVWCAAACLH